MQIVVGSTQLASAVSYAAKVISARPSQPILSAVKLVAAENEVLVLGVGDVIPANALARFEAEVTEPGTVLLPGRLLAEVASSVKGDVKMSVVDGKMRVVAGKAKFALPLLPPEDFPAPMADPERAAGTISTDQLVRAIELVATATDPHSPMVPLQCIRVELTSSSITFAATDRYRLASRVVEWEAARGFKPIDVTLNAKLLLDTVKGLAKDGERVTISFVEGDLVVLAGDSRTTKMNTIDGDYPSWRSLIPKKYEARSVTNGKAALETLTRVAIVGEKNDPVSLDFGPDLLKLTSGDVAGTGCQDEVAASSTGEQMSVWFNPTYLRDGLALCASLGEEVSLDLISPNKPVVLRPVDDPNYLYLVMTVRRV